jgi:hypothetical protein
MCANELETAMSRSGLRRAAVVLVTTAFALLAVTVPAYAGPATISSLKPLTVKQVSSQQVRAMAASGDGALLSFTGATVMDVTCYLAVGEPYGGGAPDADVTVDAAVYCDDYVDAATLQVQLYRSNSLVASDSATFPYTYGVYGTVGITDCVEGSYFGAATAIVARYDLYPPVIGATKRSFDVSIGCGSGNPGIPTPPNCEVNPQLCARAEN